jgi:predicted exporter
VLEGFSSPLAWLPPVADQQAMLEAALEPWGAKGVGGLVRGVESALRRRGLRPEAFSPGLEVLRLMFEDPRPLDLPRLLADPDTEGLFSGFFHQEDGAVRAAVFLTPVDRRTSAATYRVLTESLEDLGPIAGVEAVVVTPRVFSLALRRASREGLGLVTAAAIVGILLVVSLHLRRAAWVALALAPLLLTGLWLMGIAAAWGIRLSVGNVAALPMILGIGIDDALHVLHHLRIHPERSIEECMVESGKALVLTTVTTICAFGSLAFAGHPSLHSMGVLTSTGLFLALVATLGVIPCAAALFPGLRRQR